MIAVGAAPADSRINSSSGDRAKTYVEARASAIAGDHARAAGLLAQLAEQDPSQTDLSRGAIAAAIGSAQMPLALQLARSIPSANLSTEARLLLVADELRHRRTARAVSWLSGQSEKGDLSFLAPLLIAWDAADRGDLNGALSALNRVQANSLLASLGAEERALILIKFRRTADAEPLARQAIGVANGREDRLRLALADGFAAAGDRSRALAMLDGMGSGEIAARARVMAGRRNGQAIDDSSKAYSEALTAFAAALARSPRAAPPIGLVQVARYANPQNSSATALLAVLLDAQDRDDEALALLRSIPADDALNSQVRDLQSRILTQNKRYGEALALASVAASQAGADFGDYSRLGGVYQAMKRHAEAADAYGRAIAIAQGRKLNYEGWTLQLLRAEALEEAGRWPEAKQALQAGLALAPDQPLLLNFLGYAKLERGEDLDAAEAMIRKASELAPEDASIIDSLGWAQFKRGKYDDAIVTLQRAAEKDSSQAEIQEHLGDALYASGRRFQARFAWNAALVTAEDDEAARIKAKLQSGLTSATAAP